MSTVHYFNGKWVPEEKLLIPAKDLSVLRGFGAFDFLRTYQGEPFRLGDHVERFYRSAHYLELEIPVSREALAALIEEGVQRNAFPETGIRMTLTGGVPTDSYMITPGTPSLIITFGLINSPDPKLYQKGGKVISTPHLRHVPQAKSLNYMTAVLAHREVKRQGAIEAVYTDATTSQIYEGTIANIFAVKDGVVITPKDAVLIGITRNVVLELCKKLGIAHREKPLFANDIPQYQEMFITGTTKEVMPVVQFDDMTIGNGKVGSVTQRLVAAFEELVGKK